MKVVQAISGDFSAIAAHGCGSNADKRRPKCIAPIFSVGLAIGPLSTVQVLESTHKSTGHMHELQLAWNASAFWQNGCVVVRLILCSLAHRHRPTVEMAPNVWLLWLGSDRHLPLTRADEIQAGAIFIRTQKKCAETCSKGKQSNSSYNCWSGCIEMPCVLGVFLNVAFRARFFFYARSPSGNCEIRSRTKASIAHDALHMHRFARPARAFGICIKEHQQYYNGLCD